MKKSLLISLLVSAVGVSACAPLIIGGAATVGVTAIHDRRTTGTVVDDNSSEIKYKAILAHDQEVYKNSHINITVYNGVILMTGEVANEAIRTRAEEIVNAKKDPQQRVVNYLVIGPNSSFANRTYDSKQTAKVKTALFDVKIKGFDPSRVKVVTEHAVTFLMGLVTEEEAQAATDVASRVKGVKQVVSVFDIIQERPPAPEPVQATNDNAHSGGLFDRVAQ